MNDPHPPGRAIFLDRDGTLNVEIDSLLAPGKLRLIDGAAEAVRRINAAGYLAILVTNQAVVARGDCGEEQIGRIHRELQRALARGKAHLDAIYYCPHHPDYTGPCDCRKPAPGMIRRAQSDFNIDLAKSWMIGDSVKDIRLARNAGVRVALVGTGKGGSDAGAGDPPDAAFDSIRDAVDFITAEAPH